MCLRRPGGDSRERNEIRDEFYRLCSLEREKAEPGPGYFEISQLVDRVDRYRERYGESVLRPNQYESLVQAYRVGQRESESEKSQALSEMKSGKF